MLLNYIPGQRIALNGNWGGYPATVVKVNDFMLTIQFDDLKEPTLILMEHIRDMELANEVIVLVR